jgi:hypothetical protein
MGGHCRLTGGAARYCFWSDSGGRALAAIECREQTRECHGNRKTNDQRASVRRLKPLQISRYGLRPRLARASRLVVCAAGIEAAPCSDELAYRRKGSGDKTRHENDQDPARDPPCHVHCPLSGKEWSGPGM